MSFATSISVSNHSFEDAGLAGGGWSDCIDVACGNPDPDDWINPDPSGVSNLNMAFAEVIAGFAADGTHHVGIDTDSPGLEVAQSVDPFGLLPNTTYTLTVAVGNRNANFSPVGSLSTIALYVGGSATTGGTLVDAATIAPPATASTFADLTLVTNTGSTVPAGALWIVLQNTGPVGRAHFDNVRLDATPIPEPSTMMLLATGCCGLLASRRKRLR